MQILVFNQYFCTPKGSYGTRIYEFAKRWVEAGDSVTVITSVYDRSDLRTSSFITRLTIDNIDVRAINVRLSGNHGLFVRALTFLIYALVSCYYALRLPADVVVASSGPITVAIPALLARYVRQKPFVFEVRDLWPEGAIQLGILRNRFIIYVLRRFEALCYRSAACVVALSEGMAEWIRGRYGIQNMEVVTNASDNLLFKEIRPGDRPGWADGKQLAVYAGGVGLIHNCGQLLTVAERLLDSGASDIKIVVIGDGNQRSDLERQARARNLENIHFLGRMSKEEVFRWLQMGCCALSVVNQNEFFDMASPNKIFDALAVGVPVVQDTQGWIKRMIESGMCGITTPRNDPEAMAAAIQKFAYNPAFRAEYAANARRMAIEQFDRGQLAARMQVILRERSGLSWKSIRASSARAS